MSEYQSNLGHEVETCDFSDPKEFHELTAERTRAMDGAMKDALKGLGQELSTGRDPRLLATTVLNGLYTNDRLGMTKMAAEMWSPRIAAGSTEIPTELGALDPKEVAELVTLRLARLAKKDPAQVLAWLTAHPKSEPTPYIQHMDESGHGTGTTASIRKLRDENGLTLKGPNMEVGSGPGNIAARLIQEGAMPEGPLTLVDSNPAWLGYAFPLITKVDPNRKVRLQPTDAARAEAETPVGTTWTALTLQWFDNPNTTVANLKRIVAQDGHVFFIGETPTNATANTARGLHGGLDIGFSHGAFSYEQVCEMFDANGFTAQEKATILRMAMPDLDEEWFDRLSPEDKKKALLMYAYSDHLMVGTAWKLA